VTLASSVTAQAIGGLLPDGALAIPGSSPSATEGDAMHERGRSATAPQHVAIPVS
jgi:hypothetical protein